jgi:hypothetical protein
MAESLESHARTVCAAAVSRFVAVGLHEAEKVVEVFRGFRV